MSSPNRCHARAGSVSFSNSARAERGAEPLASVVLDDFQVRLTNSCVDGKNNRTKLIKRQAYGNRNKVSLRLRVLLPSA